MKKEEFKKLHENARQFLSSNNKINEDSYQQASVDLYLKQFQIAIQALETINREAEKSQNSSMGLARAVRGIIQDLQFWYDNTKKLPPR